MKKKLLAGLAIGLLTGGMMVANAQADTITTSANGTFFGDAYSYEFSITDETGDPSIYSATLENTTDSSVSDAVIDLLAFNMDAVLGTDFNIVNISPVWTFTAGSGGILFDYIGEDYNPPGPGDNKLYPSDELTFDFVFTSTFMMSSGWPSDPFTLWTETDPSSGAGIGGGTDSGQVAVSFQTLGFLGNDSDLLASDWEHDKEPVPEPATMLLFGTGLVGLAGFRRRQSKKI